MMNKDISTAEAAVLGTIGFPLTIHRTICERAGESVSISVGDHSTEYPQMQARAVLREMRAGCLPPDSPAMDAMMALENRQMLVAALAGRLRGLLSEQEIPGRFRIVESDGWYNYGTGVIETPDIFMATTLCMLGHQPMGIRGGNGASLFKISRYRSAVDGDGANDVMAIREGRMPKNHPAMTWYLACWNLSEINRAIRESKAMLFFSKPGLTRDGKALYAYVREDSPNAAFDKVHRFFGN